MEYLMHDSDLIRVADAIRAKGGTSAALTFPADFVSAIAAIETGGPVQSGTITGGSTALTIPVTGAPQNVLLCRTVRVADLTESSYYFFLGINGTAFGMRYSHSSASWGYFSPTTTSPPSYTATDGSIRVMTNSYVLDRAEYVWIAW